MAKKAGSDVSISDIAEKCGVSAMTVSRVMRQSPVVSKKTLCVYLHKIFSKLKYAILFLNILRFYE